MNRRTRLQLKTLLRSQRPLYYPHPGDVVFEKVQLQTGPRNPYEEYLWQHGLAPTVMVSAAGLAVIYGRSQVLVDADGARIVYPIVS